jgi:hypothetical protein
MERLSPDAVSAAILAAPAFAHLGLSVRDARLRARAVDALSVAIVEGLERRREPEVEGQLALPL